MVAAMSETIEITTAQSTSKPRRMALSPSRASDFKQCPLLYRLRTIDRIPEQPTRAQVRGTVVHAVLEQLFALPATERSIQSARQLIDPTWTGMLTEQNDLAALFTGPDDPELTEWLASVERLLDGYFTLEDPARIAPQACELFVETELPSGALLRGFVDRVDVAPTGEIRVVDYKTGSAPRESDETKVLFQMKFYALVLWRMRGIIPKQLRLMYLASKQNLTYTPDESELLRFERMLEALWTAIVRAGQTGDFPARRSKLCDYCDHKALCPEFGGTVPEYPGWPEAN